ncbi:MAG: hypothetical protein Q8Q60_00085 [Candidatus Chromulinivorax sp.]|nr:hypothetical protein [Candidatus Chromulinivorax sp.]
MFFVRLLTLLFTLCFSQVPANHAYAQPHSNTSSSVSSRSFNSRASLYSPRKSSNTSSLSAGAHKKAEVSSSRGGGVSNDLLWITVAISILAYKAGVETYRYGTKYYEKERETQQNQENIDIQLAHYNYKFAPSTQSRQQLENAQNAILKEKEAAKKRTFLEGASHAIERLFVIDENKKAEENALVQIQDEEKEWKFKSLLEIEEKRIQREKYDEEIEEDEDEGEDEKVASEPVDLTGGALFAAAPIVWIAGGLGGPVIAPYVAPVVGIIYVGITIANIIKNSKGGGSGGDGEDEDKDKTKNKNKKSQANEKKQAAVDNRLNRIQESKKQIEAQLPSGYKATRDKSGNYPRNKNGDLVDNIGHTWHWNVNTNKFDVFTRSGNLVISISPTKMKVAEPQVPEQKGCGDWTKPQPTLVLDHPVPPIEKPKQGGCGGEKIETPTSTAHIPYPDLDKIDKQPKGCGKPVQTSEEQMNMAGKKEDLLPSGGGYPFKAPKTKDGKIPRNKEGDYIDDKGNGWKWDPYKQEWDVQTKQGHRNVNSSGTETHKGTHPNSKSGTSKSVKDAKK